MRGKTSKEKVKRLMIELGRAARTPGRVYFAGGTTAVLLGWREGTMDVDLKADPEPAGFFEALPRIKELIDLNIELASPDDFVPALPNWKERSVSIQTEGLVEFFHYDFYAQALSKIERWHRRDQSDVERMYSDGIVKAEKLWELFCAIEEKLIRYPSIDAPALKTRVAKLCGK